MSENRKQPNIFKGIGIVIKAVLLIYFKRGPFLLRIDHPATRENCHEVFLFARFR